ncbi:hypothetical protein HO133_005642 [Letharia lupina]|uniref:Zn(2)-C6 fungal-type domain-containing protein n=1 Tax=Letharia lupina TaxID=560253 RepID=A0A8H6C7V6_9LECA|nr:uncharacterized protein HO133_005642 [Letharia lupina]KAF6218296.1 hypothetical protein HO133_005642 [Letharia lupina]
MPTPTAPPIHKTLSACDECRTRKLKCSGEAAGCSRCKSESTTCHYSQKKTMGRPRKRRHEEAGGTDREENMGASEGLDVGAADVGPRDSHLATFSGNDPGLGTDGFHFSGNSLEEEDTFPFGPGNGSIFPDTDCFSFDLPEGPASNLEQGLPDWDPSQDLGQPFSTLADTPLRLQTPPNVPGKVDSNSCSTGNAVIGCSCLSSLYSMLAKFQSLPETSFPYSMGALRSAASLGRSIVACHNCLQAYNTALQNTMLLGALLQLLIIEYAKLLKHIEERSKQAEKIAFRFGDPSSPFDSRHTGRPDCPMAINIDLSGDEWRTLARKAVAQEVNNSQGSHGLFGLVQEMRDRQVSWHERFSKGQHTAFHCADHQQSAETSDNLCVQIMSIDNLKRSLETLGL